MCLSVSVYTRGFDTTLLLHVTVPNCVNDCPESILGVELVTEMKFQHLDLNDHLASIF
jgi:hypothetical protein